MKMRGKLLAVLLAAAMLVGMLPAVAYAAGGEEIAAQTAQFSDMPDDWSTRALENAVANGLLTGVDGKILPNELLTRGQMAMVVTRAFGASVEGDISAFPDVKSSDWFASGMAKAYQMKVIQGSAGKLNPNDSITREEVFLILARALKLPNAAAMNVTFSDAGEISGWAAGGVGALVNAGYVQGAEGKLSPKSLMTRAQFAQIFDNILKAYVGTAGVVTTVPAGNVMVRMPGVTLRNLTVVGDLIVGDGVGDGEITLDNVTVTGRLVVRGGGEHSVIIRGNSSVRNVVVARIGGAVSVKVEGDADVEVIYIDDGSDDVFIEGTVGSVEVQASGITVTAAGAIATLNVAGGSSTIVVAAGSTVGAVNVQRSASNTQVQVSGTVTNVTTAAPGTSVGGSGTVTKVEVRSGANHAAIETRSTQIVVGAGVTGVTGGGGTPVEGGSTVNNNASGTGTTPPSSSGGGGGGGSGPVQYAPTATNVAIAGAAQVGETLVGSYTYSDANGDGEGTSLFQWYANTGTGGAYEAIADATGRTYTIGAALEGHTIQFEVTPVAATGTTTGAAVRSAATAAVAAPSTLSGISVTGISIGGAMLSFTSSRAGTYYYLALAAAATAPDAAAVVAQGSAAAKGTGTASAGSNGGVEILHLEPATAYKVYLVVVSGGIASDVSAVDLTTNPAAVDLAGIAGVTAPVPGATPVTSITATEQYTGTVAWSPAHTTFKAGYTYAATITLTARDGYTLAETTANFFTVAGASSVSNAANAGVVTAVFPATTVTTAEQLQAALADTAVTAITLGGNITGDVTATRAATGTGSLTLNFGAYALDGDLSFTAPGLTAITLNGTANPAVDGSLTIDAPAATVTNYLTTGAGVFVNGVSRDTWIEYADGNRVYIDDGAENATIQIHGNPEDVQIESGASGISITAVNPVGITVEAGASVDNIVVGANAAGTTITNNGTVGGVTANANTNINTSSDVAVFADDTIVVGASGAGSVTGVTAVTDISASLAGPALAMGAAETGSVTGVAPEAGQTYHVVSASPEIVSVDAAAGLALTAHKAGKAAVTVQILNSGGAVVKQGTVFVTVAPARISAASVTMTAPVLGTTPQTAAQVQTATAAADYDVTGLVWNEALTPAGTFKAGQVYTATVTLTAKTANAKAFQSAAFTPTVSAAASVGTTATRGDGAGNSVTFMVTFPATAAKTVTGIKVTTQAAKMTYTHDEALDLSGLIVTETYNDGTTGAVTFADGTATGYTASPANGTTLATDTHGYTAVTVTHTASALTAATAKLTVKNNAQAAPTGLLGVAATPGANDGSITGTTTTPAMEYKAAAAATYTTITGASVTGLAPGNYQVRLKAYTGYDPSPAVTVLVPGLSSIALDTSGVKTAYKVGETLSVAGLIVTGTYSDGSARFETVTAANVTDFDSTAVAESQILTVTLGGISTTYTISIAKADGPALTGVSANDGSNTVSGLTTAMEYKLDDDADYTTYDAAVFGIIDFSGYHTLLVRFAATTTHTAGPATAFLFTEAALDSISPDTVNAKTAYKVGEALDISGLVVTGTYSDGSTRTETITAGNVTGFNSAAVTASQTLTVTVGGVSAAYTVSVAKANGPALAGVAADDAHNTVSGLTIDPAMQFSTDGTTWLEYNGSNLPSLVGSTTIRVRMKETGTHTAGPATTFTFTVDRYTLTYLAGTGGSVTGNTSQTVTSGASGTAVTAVPAAGYTFAGWSDGVQTAARTDAGVTANKTVTANFTINQYTVTFKNHDGSVLKAQTVNYGSAAAAPDDPARPADAQYTYAFSGWDRAFAGVTANLTVTAVYSRTARSYTVTFKDWDGATIATRTVAYGSAATAPESPTRSGYLFTGWDVPFDAVTGGLTVTATYRQNVLITAFDQIAPVNAGTTASPRYANAAAVIAALPKVVTANSGAVTVSVAWTDTDAYNTATAGSYTFTAVLGAIPTGYSNANGLTATVEVVVKAADISALTGEPTFAAGTPAMAGTQLTAGPGNLNVTDGLTYKWYRSADATLGSGDTLLVQAEAYTPVAADVGSYLILAATTPNAAGTRYVALKVFPVYAGTGSALTGYDTIQAAIAADGGSIKLNRDVTMTETIEISRDVTLDLNNHNITGSDCRVFIIASGTLTLEGEGTLSSVYVSVLAATGSVIRVSGTAGAAAVVIGANVTVSSSHCYGVSVFGASTHLKTVTVEGTVSVSGTGAAIGGNGTAGQGNTVINVNAGAVVSSAGSTAIYHPQAGTLNITGGTVTGLDSAIGIKAGQLNISGGVIRATGENSAPTAGYSNGINASGAAIQIESNDGYAGEIDISITGGSIISDNGYSLYEYLDSGNAATEVSDFDISGGSFTGGIMISAELAAAAGRPSITGGTFSDLSCLPYLSSSANVGIMLEDDVELGSKQLTLDSGATVTINLNGHDITGNERLITLAHGTLNLTGAGTIKETSPNYAPIILKGSFTDTNAENHTVLNVGENVTLEGWAGVFITTNTNGVSNGPSHAYGVVVNMDGTINSVKDTANYEGAGIYLNGSNADDTGNVPVINIGATADIAATGEGVYAAGYGKWTVADGASIAGNVTGFEIRTGELTVEGGTITGGSGPLTVTPNDSGSTTANSALAIAQHTTRKPITVTVNGGTFTGTAAFNEANSQTGAAVGITLSITGGTFNGAVTSEDCTGFITGGTFSENVDAYVAAGYRCLENGSAWTVQEADEGEIGTIAWDEGTGGGSVTVGIFGRTATFGGTIAYYVADESVGRMTAGNRVGVKITAPANLTADLRSTAVLTIGTQTYAANSGWMDGSNYFYYYPLVTAANQTLTLTVQWDGTTTETYVVRVAGAALEAAYAGVYNASTGVKYDSLTQALELAAVGNKIAVAGDVGSASAFTLYNVTKALTIQGAGDAKPTIYGSFHVYADGVGFDNLVIRNQGGGVDAQKAAIDVLAKQVSITDCDFVMGITLPAGKVANGVTIWPLGTADFSLTMSGNTFTGYNVSTGDWSSCAFQIVENININTSRFALAMTTYGASPRTGSIIADGYTADEYEAFLTALQTAAESNTYSQCANDFVYLDWAAEEYQFVYATSYAAFADGVAYAGPGAWIILEEGMYDVPSQINVAVPMAIRGAGDAGDVTLQATGAWPTSADANFNSTKHLLDVYPSDTWAGSGVSIENITFDSNGRAYGIQVYGTAVTDTVEDPYAGPYDAVLDSITLENSLGAGLTVNGARVSLANSTVTDNAWGSVNVDPGSGVSTPSVLWLDAATELLDGTQIWSDGDHVAGGEPAVIVTAPADYVEHRIADGGPNFWIWSNGPASLPSITTDGITTEYRTIQAAVTAASDYDTIYLPAGTYTTTAQIVLDKPLTIAGAGDATILTNGTSTFFQINAENITLKTLRFLDCATASTVRAGTAADATGLTVDNVTFENGQMAISIYASESGNEGASNGITIVNSSFIDYSTKGIYLEKGLNVTIADNIFTNTGSDPDTGNPLANATGSGIDINLKHGTYSGYTITGNTFTNCGQHPTSVNGAAILLKARDDGSYASPPVTLTNVTISGNTFNRNKAVLILGEAGAENAGPGVTLSEADLEASNTLGTGDDANTTVLIDNRAGA